MRLSANFTLDEFERSETAARRGIDNRIPADLIPNVQRLVAEILQPFREQSRAPITVTSGYRCPELNAIIGGSKRSQHMTASAADFRVVDEHPLETASRLAESGLRFDQIIHEFGQWVHVSVAAAGTPGRRELLTIDSKGTRVGLHEART